MQPTAAPWTKGSAQGADAPSPRLPSDLPAVSRGETTRAPWSTLSGPALTGRPVEAAIRAEPAWPEPPTGGAAHWRAHVFAPASKRISSVERLRQFLQSQAARDFLGFVCALNDAAKGHAISEPCPESATVLGLVRLLGTLNSWVDDIPPAVHSLRYGNPAYRVWSARLVGRAQSLLEELLPAELAPAAAELAPYLADSFGNATRIDYGTGHETTFVALLYCLARLGVLRAADARALVLRVFPRYLRLMRRVQTTYWLEPAGSHGVWGLDDYQFLPFVWGSAQLVDHPFLRPSSIHDPRALEKQAEDFLYFASVRFVKQVKNGPLQETSPMLNDISGLPTWTKVNRGMLKMYQAELLAKFPIMQHFLFGTLLAFDATGAAAAAAPRQPPPALPAPTQQQQHDAVEPATETPVVEQPDAP